VKHPKNKIFKKNSKKSQIIIKKSQMNQKGAWPGSASGCLKKATQIPKAGHPIYQNLSNVF
jgi:hypothetical protein